LTTYGRDELAALGGPVAARDLRGAARRTEGRRELAKDLPISRPAVSQHLEVLREAGLVTDQKAGTRHPYLIRPEGIAALRTHLDWMWDDALAAFATAAAREESEDEG
jgi:DNA-binding transcriptional ArsR family regulator